MQAKSPLMIAVVAALLLPFSHPLSLAQSTPETDAARPITEAGAAGAPLDAPTADPAAKTTVDPALQADAQLRQTLAENRLAQAELIELRRRLVAAEATGHWLPWLMLVLLATLAMAVWLGLRVRRLQREHARRDWAVAQAELLGSRALDGVASGSAPLLSPDQPLLSGASAAAPTGSALAAASAQSANALAAARTGADANPRTRADASANSGLSAQTGVADSDADRLQNTVTLRTGVPVRPVSVEELLDLEQQVDFFMVLGQEQAAIDLLLGHVRATGGINALPYFKLLEIYRQQGDEEAFERTRERFNQRFNATAPDWSGDLAAGRHLIDYPDVILRLQRAWAHPLRAVAELDGMLLRRADLEPFDLPAFHDILTLQALVRDLPAGAVAGSGPAAELAIWGSAPASASASASVSASVSPPAGGRRQSPAERAADSSEHTVTLASYAGLGAPQGVDRALTSAAMGGVDLLLPLDGEALEVTEPRPRMSEPGAARAMLADWMLARSTMQAADLPADTHPGRVIDSARKPAKLDLDLSDFAPAPREFTRPAAFTELDRRQESRMSDFSAFEDSDLPPPATSRR